MMTYSGRRRFPILIAAIAALALAMALLFSPVQAQEGSAPGTEPDQSVSEGDTDLPNDNSTPGRVAVGGSATGAIGTPGDQDRFAVELEAGRTYRFDLTGSPGRGGTLPDTYFRALYNSEGQYQPDSYNDDFEGGRDSRVTFTPPESGAFYARVSGDRDETGSYTLSVTEVPPEPPARPTGVIGASSQDLVKLFWTDPQDGGINGYRIMRREPRADDSGQFVAVNEDTGSAETTYTDDTVEPDRVYVYQVRAIGSGGVSEPSRDVKVRGTTEVGQGFREGATDLPANATTSGVVVVDGFGARGAIHEPIHRPDNYRDLDTDWFAVELKAGRTYRIDMKGAILVAPDTYADDELTLFLPQINAIYDADGDFLLNTFSRDESSAHHLFRVTFHAHADGTYYIAASGESFEAGGYELRVIDITRDADEHAADPSTTGTVAVGGSTTGKIDFSGDRDWFKVTLADGTEYQVDLEGQATGRGSLRDPVLRGIFDADGNEIPYFRDDDGGEGSNARVTFTPGANGVYYVAAGSFGDYLEGTYALSVKEVVEEDDDGSTPVAVTVEFGAATYTATEGGSAATVTVNLSADPERSVTIPIVAAGAGGATAGDYTLSANSVTIDSGDTSATFTVTAVDDSADDDGESVNLSFGTLPDRVSPGTQSTATVNLTETDSTPPSPSAAQVSADGTTIDIVFDEDLDARGSAPAATAFKVTVDGGTPVTPDNVDFHASDADTFTLTMAAADAIASGDTVTVAYDKPEDNPLKDAADNEVADFTQTVLNRPAAPVVTLTTGNGKLTATWAAPANGGSAITGYDVEWKTASQTWAQAATAGQSDTAAATAITHEITGLTNGIEHTVRARARNDAGDGPWSAEASETPNSSVTQVTAEFGAASYTALEGRGAVTITVSLSADPERSVNVPITVTENGGAGTGDYTLSATSVTIGSGDTSATFTVTATDDDVHDGDGNDETLALGFGTLPDGVSPGTQATTDVSLIDNEVLVSSDLVPGGIAIGGEFRLLFVTSNRRTAQSSDIAKYNKFVQDAAASGHTDIQDYSSLFRALASTASIDARDNTATNRNKDGPGEEIWWLNGPKAADDYADFYNGSWDHRNPGRDQNGAVHDFPTGTTGTVWTGSQSNGQGDSGNELGTGTVATAKPSSGSGFEIHGASFASGNGSKPLYGLSFVQRAAVPADVPYVTGVEVDPKPSNDVYYTNDTVTVKVTFSEDVQVTGTPTFPLEIGSNTRDAEYQDGQSTDTVLVFTYLITDTDLDLDGFSSTAKVLGLPTSASITRLNDSTVAAYPGPIPLNTDFAVNPPPVITGVEVTSSPQAATDTYGRGEDIQFTVTFSEAVTVTGDVTFRFSAAGVREARLKSGNGTDELVFAYTVQIIDDDDNGIFILNHTGSNQSFNLGTGQSIVGADTGLDAVLEHGGRRQEDDHKVDGSLTGADATLSALSLSGITLDQTFTAGAAGTAVTSFTATTSLSSTVVTATASQSGGSSAVSIDPADADGNTTDHEVNLSLGDTVITVEVTSTNGNATRTYTVTVTREAATDTTAPEVSSAQVSTDGTTIDIVFDEDLDSTGSVPAASAFEVTVDGGTAVNPDSVDFDDDFGDEDTIILTMATANTIAAGAAVSVAYDKPTSNALADAASNEVADFTQTATNRTAAPVVTLSAGDGKLTASWAAPANGGSAITGYDVEWKTAAQTWDEAETAGQSDTATSPHEITGLTNDTEYTVRVRASNAAGDGPWSAEASETPFSPPDAPGGLNAQVTYREVELSWNDPNNSDIESYQYRVSDDGGNNWDPDWTEIDGSGASTTSLTLSGLDHRTEYTFRVRAVVAGVSGEAASVTATPAATGVPHDWDLRPPGIATGETFRLLIVTSTWRNGESGDVDDYNDHVQDAVASGHADIQEYSSDFRALVGTRDGASPRDNTHSNPDSDGDGEHIWWLKGPRAANDYDDFYDGDWDHTNPVRLESGNSETFYQEDDSSQLNYHRAIWTGARADGSRAGRKHLGNDDGVSTYVGIPYRMDGPLRYRNWGWEPDRVLRLYGLSPVFRVEAPDAPYATTAAITTEPANGTDYRAGEVVKATVTFSEDVTVTGTPQLPLRIGDEERDADYAAGDSSSTVLSFSYLVTDDDTDRDGISIDAFALKLNGGSIKRKDTNVDAALTHTRVLADDEQRVNLRPIITGVEVTSTPQATNANDTYGLGEDIEITVTFSEAVTVTGDVAFGFGVSGQREARLKSGNGTTELVFAYTVQATDDDDNGIWIGDHTHATNPTFDLEAGQSVVGAVTGLDALLEHDKLETLEDHKVDGSLTGADATLSALSLSGITLDQTFTAGAAGTAVTSFTATTSLSSTVVTATASQSGGSSSVSIDPADADANTTDHEVNLSLGDTVITVEVTSTNGDSTRTYTVTVTRQVVTDTTAPSASAAQVSADGMSIDVVFDEDLDATGSAPAALAFQVTVGTASAVNPSSVDFHATVATTVVLTMTTAIAAGETVSVAYTKPASNALADAASNEVESFTGADAIAAPNRPAAPVVSLSAGVGKLTASWTAPANGGSAITGYDVQWKTGSQTWAQAATAGQSDTAAATAITHEITGLTNGIEHTVRARARNDAGDGPWSAEASETPNSSVTQVTAEFGAASYTALEGRGAVTITVSLSADPERSVNVPITVTENGGAGTGDYTRSATSVTIDSGDTSATFTVTATDDDVYDGDGNDETLALGLGTLPDGVSPGTQATTDVSLIDNEVLVSSDLVPEGTAIGGGFRLLFVTSGERDATSMDIADYDAFVQETAAASGHNDIAGYGSLFRVLGSTGSVSAHNHTGTTYTSSEPGVPIWWLKGPRAADDYEDFYDGSWDHRDPGRNEDGSAYDFAPGTYVWTGSNANGSKSQRPLGGPASFSAQAARPGGGTGHEISSQRPDRTLDAFLYGLSYVLRAAAPADVPYVTGVQVDPEPTNDVYYTNDTVTVKVTFSEAVSVSGAGTPTFPLLIGSNIRDAEYQSIDATGTVLSFAYTVQTIDEDDDDGISSAAKTLGLPTNASISRLNDSSVAAYPGPIALNTDFVVVVSLADLRTLTVDDGSGAAGVEDFAANTTEYNVGVAGTVARVTVAATPLHSSASVAYSTADADGDTAGYQVDLSGGKNTVTVTVTAGDGTITKEYALIINRAAVPHDWSLRPDSVPTGETFRLLIVTSTRRDGTSGDIADYDAHVRSALADRGHSDIREYSPQFKALAATRGGAHPMSHTDTDPDSDGPGEEIWWLNGPKAAADYADFYDSSWDHSNPARTQSGGTKIFSPLDSSIPTVNISGLWHWFVVWTGTRANGTRSDTRHLGTTQEFSGYRGSNVSSPYNEDGDDVWSIGRLHIENRLGLYGLSAVLYIEPPDGPYATVAAVQVPDNGTDYLTGETITATVTFSEAVSVSGSPRLPLQIGSNTRYAAYQSIDTAGMVLSFSYTVQDGDQDLDGLAVDKFALELNGGTITGTTGANAGVDAALTHTGVLADENQKVNPPSVITKVEVTSTPQAATETYGLGEDIEFTVTFSRAVTVTGGVEYGFSLSGQGRVEARLVSGNGTDELVFAYTVQATDDDDNGIFILNHTGGNQSFNLGTGQSIVGADTGLDAVLEHGGRGQEDDHKVDGSLTGADATLSALSLSGITLDQTFTAGAAGTAVTSFTATTTVTSTTVTATASQSGGSSAVSIDPADADGNTTDHEVNLSLGDTVITVEVTSTNGDSTRAYTVTVTREAATDTTAPEVSSARVVVGNATDEIHIFFDEDLDRTGSKPAASAFQVTVGTASAVNPSSVDFHTTAATTVVLTMGTAIAAGETVSVAYTKPTANALADAASNKVESFTGQAATNRPAAPVVTLSAGDGKLTASWTAPANGGSAITGYDVQWKTAAQTWDEAETAGQSDTAAATATTHEITGLTNDTEYTVRVRASNAAGDGPWSAEASETPAAAGITVSWSAASYAALEGHPGTTVTLALSAAPTGDVTVMISFELGGGAEDADYSGVPTSVTFDSASALDADGRPTESFVVVATDDDVVDPGETVTLSFGTPLPSDVTAGTQSTAMVSLVDNDIPFNSSLAPAGTAIGDGFRLLFVTSGKRKATSADIADYNDFVQRAAASGHADIQDYGGQFQALASTASRTVDGVEIPGVDARDNTATNPDEDGTGVPIWWLNGPRAANNYDDFYDDTWDHQDPGRNQAGAEVDFGDNDNVWTGTDKDGTARRPLGGSQPAAFGRPPESEGALFYGFSDVDFREPLYALSYVLYAAAPVDTPYVTGVEAVDPPRSAYRSGDTIRLEVTFSEDVTVSGEPTFPLSIGNDTRQAQYQDTESTSRVLVFTHEVTDDDYDNDTRGISNAELELALPTGTSITRQGDNSVAAYPGSIVWEPGLKVNSPPRLTGIEITSTPEAATNTYGLGEDIEFTVTFDVEVTVNGDVTLGFFLGGVQFTSDGRQASLTSGDGAARLVFTYTVKSSDSDNVGISVGESGDVFFDPFTLLSNQSITGPLGTDANLAQPGLDRDPNHLVDGSRTGADARLSNLSLDGVTLVPAFAAGVRSYTASADAAVDSTTVTAAAVQSSAGVDIDPDDDDNATGHQVDLAAGATTRITVTVTAPNDATVRVYTIDVTREAATDTTAPSVSSAQVSADGTSIAVVFNEDLDATGSAPAATAFEVTVGTASAVNPAGVAFHATDANTITLTMESASPIAAGKTVTVAYTKPTANALADAASNEVESFTGTDALTAANRPLAIVGPGGEMVGMKLDRNLAADTPAPAASAFTVTVGSGTPVNPASVALNSTLASLVELTMGGGDTIPGGAEVTVAYTAPASGGLRYGDGNEVESFTVAAVNRLDAPAEVRAYAGNQRVDLAWDPPASGASPSGYRVEWKAPSDSSYASTNRADVAADVTLYAITGLTNGDPYVVRVRPLDSSHALLTDAGDAAESAEVTVGRPKAVVNVTVAGRHEDFRVSWDAPVERGVGFLQDQDSGEPVLVYRITWKKQGQSQDLAQYQALCRDGRQKTAVNGWFEITSVSPPNDFNTKYPQDGDTYEFTVEARFQAGGSVVTRNCRTQTGFGEDVEASATAERATASEEDHAAVHTALAAVVDARAENWPWLRAAWVHVADQTVQAADRDPGNEGNTGVECLTTNSAVHLGGCTFTHMTIDMDWDLLPQETFEYVAVHELAHVWTLVNDQHDEDTRGPVGRAVLYFFGQEYKGSSAMMELCAAETLADALTHVAEDVAPAALIYYGDQCFSDARTEPTALSEEVALYAMHPSGADPNGVDTKSSWFTETFTGATASADAWAAVSEIESKRHRYLLLNLLQDEFSRLCSIRAANKAVFDDDSDINSPWQDGGCEPDAPTVTAESGSAAGAVDVSWTAPANAGGAPLLGYTVQWKLTAQDWPQEGLISPTQQHGLDDPVAVSYTITGLNAGWEHTVRVRARNSIGDGVSADESVTAGSANRSVPPPPKNLRAVRAVEEQGGVRLTWQPPDGATVTGYRIERRRAGEGLRDNHTLVEDTGSPDTSYTDQSAEEGVEYEYRISARNESGPGEGSDWVRAVPEEEPVFGDGPPGAPGNLTVTAGDQELTLSWEPPADNGNAPATRYRIEWRMDGKDYKKGHWGTSGSTTYTKTDLANGVKYIFRVKAENGSGNSYGPYGPASEEVSATPTSGSAVDLGTPVLSNTKTLHHGMVRLDWEDIEDAGWYVVQYYHVKSGEWLDLPAAVVDVAFHGSGAVVSNLHGLSWLRVRAMSCAGESEWSQIEELYGTKASDWEDVPVPEVAEGDQIEPCPVVLGTPVLSNTQTLHHGMVRLDWEDIEDAGWYVVQYYHVKSGEWLDLPAAGVDIAFHGSSAVVSNLHGLSWLRVRAMSCAGESEWSQIEELYGTNASDWEGVPVPEVAEGDEIEPCSEDVDTPANSPATGAPTISGTVQVGETLTADTADIADANGLSNVQYEYQWLADDSDISGATNATYTLVAEDEGKAIKVQVSFTDDEGNEETLTSEATDAVAAAPTPNTPATGAPTISGTAQVGETLTANTSEVADSDGLSNVQYEYHWLADDADISGATNATYTLADSEESKTIKVQVSFTDDAGNEETLTSAATDAVAAAPTPNSPATGAPTITGTAQVGEALTADTSGVIDADGLSNVQYEYQWLADDAEIAGATGSTHTLADTNEGKAIKVRVSFADDAGNGETLTSAATDAVSAAEPSEPPDKPTGLSATATHDQVVLTWDDPQDDSITGYVILRRVRENDEGGEFSELVADTGTAATTYTDATVVAETTYTYRIKAINGAGTSERSRWFHIDIPAAPVPDKPTGLSATATHDQVVLTWDDPGDDSVTGYVILRRLRYDDPKGHFDELVADTGTADTTYTDDTVAAGTSYTYRIKAINGAGPGERSRWFHIDTPAAP